MKNKKKADWLDWLLRIAIVLGIIGTFYFSYSPAKNYVTAKQEEAKIEEVSKKVVENMLLLSHILDLQHYNIKIHSLRKLKINY